jgi:hypothetical protein
VSRTNEDSPSPTPFFFFSHRTAHERNCQVSEAAKRALAELRKSRPDVDESNLKVDIPVARAPPRPGVAPHQAMLGLNGGAFLPAYRGGPMGALAARAGIMGGGVGMGMGMGAGAGAGMGMGMGAGAGAGVGMGMGMGARMGVPMGMGMGVGLGNQFIFGAGQPHQFIPPAHGAPYRPGLDLAARVPQAAIPVPAMLAFGGGRAPPAPVPAQAQPQPVVAAGGGGRRRKGR